MLVLSRKPEESIFINDEVVVTVLSIRGNKVRLGIDAPIGVPVHRRECCGERGRLALDSSSSSHLVTLLHHPARRHDSYPAGERQRSPGYKPRLSPGIGGAFIKALLAALLSIRPHRLTGRGPGVECK